MKRKIVMVVLFVVAIAFTVPAMARDTKLQFSAKKAAAEGELHENLLDIPFYMKGQKHPKVKKSITTAKSNQKGRAFGRSDEAACQVAFLNSLLSLQRRASDVGADAVINIVSYTKNHNFESAKDYECVTGTFVSHVALKGEMVKFAQ